MRIRVAINTMQYTLWPPQRRNKHAVHVSVSPSTTLKHACCCLHREIDCLARFSSEYPISGLTFVHAMYLAVRGHTSGHPEVACHHRGEHGSADLTATLWAAQIDKEGANLDRVKQELSEAGVQPEDWGGDVPTVPVRPFWSYVVHVMHCRATPSCECLEWGGPASAQLACTSPTYRKLCVLGSHLAQRMPLESVTAIRNAGCLLFFAPAAHNAGHASLRRMKHFKGSLEDAVGG